MFVAEVVAIMLSTRLAQGFPASPAGGMRPLLLLASASIASAHRALQECIPPESNSCAEKGTYYYGAIPAVCVLGILLCVVQALRDPWDYEQAFHRPKRHILALCEERCCIGR